MKVDRYVQHSRDCQLNNKRLLELDLTTLIKKIKEEEFDERMAQDKKNESNMVSQLHNRNDSPTHSALSQS